MARLPRPVTMMTRSSPAATASSTTYWIMGLSTRGSISLGWAFVAGRKRVPRPAAGNTAVRTLMRPTPFGCLRLGGPRRAPPEGGTRRTSMAARGARMPCAAKASFTRRRASNSSAALLERDDAGVETQDRLGRAALAEPQDALRGRRLQDHRGMRRRQGLADLAQHPERPVHVLLVVDRHLDDQAGPPGGVMTERGQLPVRDDAELAGELPDLGDAQPDGLDHARVLADLDDVANRDQVLEKDEESHDDVADEALRPEADARPRAPPPTPGAPARRCRSAAGSTTTTRNAIT